MAACAGVQVGVNNADADLFCLTVSSSVDIAIFLSHAAMAECACGRREAEALLASAGRLLGRPAQLPPGLIEATRMRDANIAEPSKAVVQSVEFHPDGQVLMTAGMDKRLRFFQVSPSTSFSPGES